MTASLFNFINFNKTPYFYFVIGSLFFWGVACVPQQTAPLPIAGSFLQDEMQPSVPNNQFSKTNTWRQGERVYFLTSTEMSFLLNVAYEVATKSVEKKNISFELKGPLPQRLMQISLPVFVCFYWDNIETSCLSAKDSNLYNNTLQAAIRAANDHHYGYPLPGLDKNRLRILISIELAQARLTFPKTKKNQLYDPEVWESFFSQQMGDQLDFGLKLILGPIKAYALNSTVQALNLQGLKLAEFMCERAELAVDCYKNPQISWNKIRYFQFINENGNFENAKVLKSLNLDVRPAKPTRQNMIPVLFDATLFLGRMFEETKKASIAQVSPNSESVLLTEDMEEIALQWATLAIMPARLKVLMNENKLKLENWIKKSQEPVTDNTLAEKRKRQQILLQKSIDETQVALSSLDDPSINRRLESLSQYYNKKHVNNSLQAGQLIWDWLLQSLLLPQGQFLVHPDVLTNRWQTGLNKLETPDRLFLSFHSYELQKLWGKYIIPPFVDISTEQTFPKMRDLPLELIALNSGYDPEKKISFVESVLIKLESKLQITFGPLTEAKLAEFNSNLHPEFWEQFGQGYHTSLGNNFFENVYWGFALLKVRPLILKYSTLKGYLPKVDFALDLITHQLLLNQFNYKNDNVFWTGDAEYWQGAFRTDTNVQTVELMNQIYAVWFLSGILSN